MSDGTTKTITNDVDDGGEFAAKSFTSTNNLVDRENGDVTKSSSNDATYIITVDTVTVTVTNGGMSTSSSAVVKQDGAERLKHKVRWISQNGETETYTVEWKDKEER